ncbi:PEP-CTERM sorting domain-containing protein [Stieleria sp. JC731]|uniref:PEP-CTERM sorting domain-containing protein n=1 Tax=Pirellulaceae TaxID=2691357 RepID=UPI001E4D6BD5|nr:PEP-CTERM sorting domain-containing protein [Stieleria sp. JC731]MCC9603404.1 PEP-CTERM sorting domain-containing protein [Stieleria sp. JC731]
MRFSTISCLVILTLIWSEMCPADVVVSAGATGGFGRYDDDVSEGGGDMVLGWDFSGPNQTILISATGTIRIGPEFPSNGPGGVAITVDNISVLQQTYTPLEQQFVDSGVLTIPRPVGDSLSDTGALIGAFVSSTTASFSKFQPRDPDTLGLDGIGIAPQDLMLIGDGEFSFTSTEAGRLYLGINDLFPSNNSGSFTVTITAIPEPTSCFALFLGCSAIVVRRKRERLYATGPV